MRFIETELAGAFVVELERRQDDRGFFARSFCRDEFEAHGLRPLVAQSNLSFTAKSGTVRGMHFQFPPSTESKLVRCVRGAVWDIIVDLRPESPTYLSHVAIELDEESLRAIYIPERFAHGHQTLRDDSLLSYQMGAPYTPNNEGGLRYDDPALGLTWPLPVTEISEKDLSFPSYSSIEQSLRDRMANLDTDAVDKAGKHGQ